MREFKTGTLKSSSGAKVRKRKQAVAIALSEARQAGAKIPKKKSPKQKSPRRRPPRSVDPTEQRRASHASKHQGDVQLLNPRHGR